MSDSKVLTGTVIWMDGKKGFGFVKPDDGSSDVFVHWSNIQMEGFKNLKPNQTVTYELGKNHRGVQCVNVRVTGELPTEE